MVAYTRLAQLTAHLKARGCGVGVARGAETAALFSRLQHSSPVKTRAPSAYSGLH